ncbi:MAG: RecQ family ATP-dependent DNA helicase [Patescibacteria group bacterium]|jgi:ATP-dependent DNA helicase RecQ|nr:RecQ family ATP-dependent DNA helicase [Patescibacteria group bacterium]
MLEEELEKYFGFSKFRSGQKEIIESILAGKDVVALMPTGGGKSLCYQLPAILGKGCSLVISPLIALMKDQVDALTAQKISATFINSSLSQEEICERIDGVRKGNYKILYVAPERLSNKYFQSEICDLNFNLLAVDEAHCVSAWGHDFRPDYLEIKNFVNKLKIRPSVAAFTATATSEVKKDIVSRLDLKAPNVFLCGFNRPNLKFFVQKNLKPREKYVEILRIINSMKGAGIIYALTRKESEQISKFLSENGINSSFYHAGVSAKKREKIQNDFMQDKCSIIVATIAFGMGVDKSDVRFVIHAGTPKNLEGYYQEAGRAGRDGEISFCVLLHGKKDIVTHKFFIRQDRKMMWDQGKTEEEVSHLIGIKYDRLDKMMQYVEARNCRRKIILKYFNDPHYEKYNENCQGCDVCLNWKKDELKIDNDSLKKNKKNIKYPLSNTVKTTGDLYLKKHSVDQMSKIRGLSPRTIIGHLADWYSEGGKLNIREFVSLEVENKIISVIKKNGSYEKLKPIKEKLPDEIGYDQIKLVVAKMKKKIFL